MSEAHGWAGVALWRRVLCMSAASVWAARRRAVLGFAWAVGAGAGLRPVGALVPLVAV